MCDALTKTVNLHKHNHEAAPNPSSARALTLVLILRQRAMRLGDTGLPGAYHVVKVQEDEAMVASAFVTEPAPSPAPSYLSQCHDVGSEDPGVQ